MPRLRVRIAETDENEDRLVSTAWAADASFERLRRRGSPIQPLFQKNSRSRAVQATMRPSANGYPNLQRSSGIDQGPTSAIFMP